MPKGEQVPPEFLDREQVFPRTNKDLFLAKLRNLAHENGYELIPLEDLEEDEE